MEAKAYNYNARKLKWTNPVIFYRIVILTSALATKILTLKAYSRITFVYNSECTYIFDKKYIFF